MMESQLDQALRGTLAILTKVQPRDLDHGLAAGLLSQARVAITDDLRGADGQALSGPAGFRTSGITIRRGSSRTSDRRTGRC
jgi:hypothetical protein